MAATEMLTKEDIKEVQQESNEVIVNGFKDAISKLQPLQPQQPQEPAQPETPSEEVPQEQRAALGTITGFSILGTPLGQAFVGGAAGVAASELVDYVTEMVGLKGMVGANIGAAIVDVGTVWLLNRYASRWLGGPGVTAAGIILGWDAVNQLVTAGTGKSLATTIRDIIPGQAPAEYGTYTPPSTGARAPGDYYEALKGGAF